MDIQLENLFLGGMAAPKYMIGMGSKWLGRKKFPLLTPSQWEPYTTCVSAPNSSPWENTWKAIRHHSYYSIYPMVATSPFQLNDSTSNLSFHPRSLLFVLTLPFLHGNPRSPLLRVLIHYPVLEQFTPGPPRPPPCSRTPDHLTPAHPLPPYLFSPCF